MKSSQFHILCAILWVLVTCVTRNEAVAFGSFVMFALQFLAGLVYGLRGK